MLQRGKRERESVREGEYTGIICLDVALNVSAGSDLPLDISILLYFYTVKTWLWAAFESTTDLNLYRTEQSFIILSSLRASDRNETGEKK